METVELSTTYMPARRGTSRGDAALQPLFWSVESILDRM